MSKIYLSDANYPWIWDQSTDGSNLASLDLETQGFVVCDDKTKLDERKAEFIETNGKVYAIICNVWMLMLEDAGFLHLKSTLSDIINRSGLTEAIKFADSMADMIKKDGFFESDGFSIKRELAPKVLPILVFPKRFCPIGNDKISGSALKGFVDLQTEMRKQETPEWILNTKKTLHTLGLDQTFKETSEALFKGEYLNEYGLPYRYALSDEYDELDGRIFMSSGSCWFGTNLGEKKSEYGVIAIPDDATSKDKLLKLKYILATGRYNQWRTSHGMVDVGLPRRFHCVDVVYTGKQLVSTFSANSGFLQALDRITVKEENEYSFFFNGCLSYDVVMDSDAIVCSVKCGATTLGKGIILDVHSYDECSESIDLSITESNSTEFSISEVTFKSGLFKVRTYPIVSQKGRYTFTKNKPYWKQIIEDKKASHMYLTLVDCTLGMEVPKTFKKRRFICLSNPSSMSEQLRAKRAFEKSYSSKFQHNVGVSSWAYTHELMPSRHQETNQMIAKFGAQTGLYATFDFSSASDQITPLKEEWVLGHEITSFMMSHAPSHIRIKMGKNKAKLIEMYSLAPMGVGSTFENEKCFYFVIAESAVDMAARFEPESVQHWFKKLESAKKLIAENYRDVRRIVCGAFPTAMGDDVTLPSFAVPYFYAICERLGLKVNADKTFSESNPLWTYRESCGKEYAAVGDYVVDVTPVYWPRHPIDFNDLLAEHTVYDVPNDETTVETSLGSLVQLQHKLYHSYPKATRFLTSVLSKYPNMTMSFADTDCDDLWSGEELGPVAYLVNGTTPDGTPTTSYIPAERVHSDDIITVDGVEVNKRIGHLVLTCLSRDYKVPTHLAGLPEDPQKVIRFALDDFLCESVTTDEIPYKYKVANLEFTETFSVPTCRESFLTRKGKTNISNYQIKF
jgi:hypothetical protein